MSLGFRGGGAVTTFKQHIRLGLRVKGCPVDGLPPKDTDPVMKRIDDVLRLLFPGEENEILRTTIKF